MTTNTPPKPNPFTRPPSNPPRLPGSAPAPAIAQPAGSLLQGRRSFGQNTPERVAWTINTSAKAAVRFQLNGLGDPFHRLLGTPLDLTLSDPARVLDKLQQDAALREQMAARLDEAWERYVFPGVALLYPFQAEIVQAFVQPPLPLLPAPAKESEDDKDKESTDLEWLADLAQRKPSNIQCLRAIDVALTLNVLARTRAQVLMAGMPLALEAGFIDATLLTDDPRLVALAQATGWLEETW